MIDNCDTCWNITESEFDPTRLRAKESLFTVGNGYLSTRGSFEEGYPGHQPATLIHGIFDDTPICYTELANAPDWLPLVVWVEGERFGLDRGQTLTYHRQIDLRRGVLSRSVRWRSPSGHCLDLHFERFVSLADPHVAALRCRITSVDFAGEIQVQAGLNGYPDNDGVMHWEWLDQSPAYGPAHRAAHPATRNTIWLCERTRHSRHELGLAARLDTPDNYAVQADGCTGYPTLMARLTLGVGQSVVLDKLVTIFTSRDARPENVSPVQAARRELETLPAYDDLLAAHSLAWTKLWEEVDILIEGDPLAQQAVRYNVFQVLAATPRGDERVSIPAKTLSGFGYRGHVFWDTEIFIVPFLTYTQPDLARNLLMYRYHTLPGARRKAAQAGYPGALFAWESADSGDEVTPRWVPDPAGGELIRIWCGDIELHINSDVAYGVYQYWQATGDDAFMRDYGAEIILDTAVFWAARAEWNAEGKRYEINNVIGPDEYHDHVNNNAFTNAMVAWHLDAALVVWAWLETHALHRAAELAARLELAPPDLAHWRSVAQHLYVHQDATGLIEQFEGFFDLPDVNLADYEPRRKSMQAILGIAGANQAQVLKQADVLMLLYLLGERYDRSVLQANWDYYAPRTDHTYGSSLGPAIHAILACRLGQAGPEIYEHFIRAARVDLEDSRGNTADGLHAASAGGLWQAVVFGFGGLRLTGAGPVVEPRLPPTWTRLKFGLRWRGQRFEFDLRPAGARPCVRGVIFDLDGVLANTAECHYQAWKRLADEISLPFDRVANEAMRGLSRRDSLLCLLGERRAAFSTEQLQDLMEHKNQYYNQLIQHLSPANLLPGALSLLDEIRAAGLKVAIGSASRNASEVIERLGIAGRIDALADGHSVVRQKPAPDLFVRAAALLGLPAGQCVVFEDAASGIEAALTAGMWTVGLGPAGRVGAAHLVLANLDGARWPVVLARLAQTV